jgi:predicted DCC family thiol-disulfide oxidoreductase YuxK
MKAVGWPWRAFSVVRFIPEPLRSFLYHRLARNR